MIGHVKSPEHLLTAIALVFALLASFLTTVNIVGDARTPVALVLAVLAAAAVFINVFGITILALLLPWHAFRNRLSAS